MPNHTHEIFQPSEFVWWPPQIDPEYSSDCSRGVWCDTDTEKRGILFTPTDVDRVKSEISEAFLSTSASRLQIKLAVHDSLIPQMSRDTFWQNGVETLFPLNGAGENFAHTSFIYFGMNRDTRFAPISEEGLSNVFQALQEQPQPLASFLQRVPAGIEIRRIEDTELSMVSPLAHLWKKFGFLQSEIHTLLTNGDNLIVGAFHDGRLISAGRANFMRHALNGIPFTLVEHTDAATLPEFEGQGLYGAVLATQMMELAALPEPPNLLVGETNILSLPALKVSRRVGREFGLLHALQAGFSGGIMRQDIAMTMDDGQVIFKDLAPAFMSREKLLSLTTLTR